MQERTHDILEQAAVSAEVIGSHLEQGEIQEAVAELNTLREGDKAQAFSQLEPELQKLLFSHLTFEAAGEILDYLDAEESVEIIGEADPVTLALWLDRAEANVAARILRDLPPEKANETLDSMTEAEAVAPLLGHEDETAGGIMTPEFVALQGRTSAAEALSWLRRSGPDPGTMNYIFVVDVRNRLIGVVALSDIVLAEPNALLRNLMDPDVIYVPTGTDQGECAQLMTRYDISSLPVVDEQRRLLGAILLEDVVEVVEEEATEDIVHLAALTEPERVIGPLAASVRNRLPWLMLNLATVALAAVVISRFESTIARLVAAAVFLPFVASQGGVGGTQTLTLMVRGMALGEIEFSSVRKALAKEVALGLINGIVLGLVMGLIALAWKGSVVLGLALGLAMIGNMIMAGVGGVVVPMGLRLLRIDPALASVVFVTTITDVFGFLFFLGLVAILLPVLD